MNDVLRRVMGKAQAIDEDDVVPVIASLPRRAFRDRMKRDRGDRDEQAEALKRTIGEAEGDVIPRDADEIEDKDTSTITAKLRPVKDVVQEPSYPPGDKEKYISPYTALTAPDITPKNLTPIDPSSLPGVKANSFQAKDAADQPATELPAPEEGADKATRAMDVLLGRQRTGSPPRDTAELADAGRVTSEAQAAALLGIGPSGEALLGQNKEMPPPVQTDGKAIYETARRFI